MVGERALVRRIAEGEEEADGDRLALDRLQRPEVERSHDAVRSDPLGDAVGALDRDEGYRMGRARTVEMGTRLTTKVKQMLESLRRHESRARALSLEQSVGRDRRPVREALDGHRAHLGGRREHRFLLGCPRRHLGRPHDAVIEQHGIRERPADVDAEDRHRATLLRTTRDPTRGPRHWFRIFLWSLA